MIDEGIRLRSDCDVAECVGVFAKKTHVCMKIVVHWFPDLFLRVGLQDQSQIGCSPGVKRRFCQHESRGKKSF